MSFGFFEPLFLVHVLDEISGDAYDIVGVEGVVLSVDDGAFVVWVDRFASLFLFDHVCVLNLIVVDKL